MTSVNEYDSNSNCKVSIVHRLTWPINDVIDRDVTFTPSRSVPYDPRYLITGCTNTTGLFDALSWMECNDGYAKTVITGRASLGGIACGVIVV